MKSVIWVKAKTGDWLSLNTFDLTSIRTKFGVYIIWHGGDNPRVVRVGQGDIADRLACHREDDEVQAYIGEGLFPPECGCASIILGSNSMDALKASELFPNAKAEKLIEECAALMAPHVVRMESAKLQVEASPRNYGMAMTASRCRSYAEDIAARYLQACCLKNSGNNLEATLTTTEQARFFRWAVYKRAAEIARPQVDAERKLVFGPRGA